MLTSIHTRSRIAVDANTLYWRFGLSGLISTAYSTCSIQYIYDDILCRIMALRKAVLGEKGNAPNIKLYSNIITTSTYYNSHATSGLVVSLLSTFPTPDFSYTEESSFVYKVLEPVSLLHHLDEGMARLQVRRSVIMYNEE